MATKDLYLGIFLILLSILSYIETLSYPFESAYFPRFIIILLLLLGVAVLVREGILLRRTRAANSSDTPSTGKESGLWKTPAFRKVSLMVFSSLVYMVVMEQVGFFVTTLVYLPIMMKLLGIQKLRTILLSTGIVVLFIYLIFVSFLNVPFPDGITF